MRTSGSSTLPCTAWTGGPSDSSSSSTASATRSPACRIASAARSRARHAPGSARGPLGMCVSLMIASCRRARRDSNPRLLPPEGSALSTELLARARPSYRGPSTARPRRRDRAGDYSASSSARTTRGSNAVPAPAAIRPAPRAASARAVRPVVRHRVVRVDGEDDPRGERDRVARQADRDSRCRPSARGSRARAARGAARPAISARISAPRTVCERTTTRSRLFSGRARSRIAAGTASLPMSCRIATSSSSNTTSAREPQLVADAAAVHGEAVGVIRRAGVVVAQGVDELGRRDARSRARASGPEAAAAGERSRSVASWVTASVMKEVHCPGQRQSTHSRRRRRVQDTHSGARARTVAPVGARPRYTRARLLTGCRKPDPGMDDPQHDSPLVLRPLRRRRAAVHDRRRGGAARRAGRRAPGRRARRAGPAPAGRRAAGRPDVPDAGAAAGRPAARVLDPGAHAPLGRRADRARRLAQAARSPAGAASARSSTS